MSLCRATASLQIGDDGACLFLADRQPYISEFFSHMSGGQYLLGDYDKQHDKFIMTRRKI